MSSEQAKQHERRLSQLKQLQEELQEQLITQISSIDLEEDSSVSDRTQLEILQTLKDKVDFSRHQSNFAFRKDSNASTCKSSLSIINNVEDLQTTEDHVKDDVPSSVPPTLAFDPPNIFGSGSSNKSLHSDKFTNGEQEHLQVDLSNVHSSNGSLSTTPFVIEDHSSSPKMCNSSICLQSNQHHQIQQNTVDTGRSVLNDTVDQTSIPVYYQKKCSSPHKDVGRASSAISSCDECVRLKAESELLLKEITQWKVECCKLEEHIEECLSINKNFMEKNNRLMRRIANYQEECESKEQLVSMLQSRIASLSEQIKQQDQQIKDIKERNEELEEELGCCIREKKDLKELFHQTSSELDSKVNELTRIELKLKAMDVQLFNSYSEVHKLKQALSIMTEKENQFKSTIYNLEEEIQTLSYINKRLNAQETHLQMSDEVYSAPRSSAVTMYNNVSDENKLTSPHVSTPPHQSFRQSPHVSTPPHQSFRQSPQNSSTSEDPAIEKRPLTKRKWLEPSEGGFIFGTPSQTKEYGHGVYSPPQTPVTGVRVCSSPKSTQGSNPPHHGYSAPVDTVLSNQGTRTGNRIVIKSPKERINEHVEERLRQVPIVENRVVELQKEKEKLEKILSKAAPTGKVTAQSKKIMNDAEKRLDEVIKEIGTARLYLWKKR